MKKEKLFEKKFSSTESKRVMGLLRSRIESLDNVYKISDKPYLIPGKFNTTRSVEQVSYLLTNNEERVFGTLMIEDMPVFQERSLSVDFLYNGDKSRTDKMAKLRELVETVCD